MRDLVAAAAEVIVPQHVLGIQSAHQDCYGFGVHSSSRSARSRLRRKLQIAVAALAIAVATVTVLIVRQLFGT